MTNVIEKPKMAIDLSKLAKGSTGPALPPSKRKGAKVETGDAVKSIVAGAVAKAEKQRNAKPVGPSLKDDAKALEALAEERGTLVNAECEALQVVEVEAAPATSTDAPVEASGVTEAELAKALEIIARATKPQAEAIRKAAADRKKVAPEGAKVKKVKELTQKQKDALAKKEKAESAYAITAMAAQSFVGKGLAESQKMQTALLLLSLPGLRWLAKQYAGVEIPKAKRSKVEIAKFLRVELLTWKPKTEA